MITKVRKRNNEIVPFEQEKIANTCICCGKPAEKMVYWGKAY